MTRRIAVPAAATAAGLLLLGACGDRPGYESSAVEGYLAHAQSGAFGPTGRVGKATCPGDLELKEGMSFRCTLDVSGTAVPYRVRLTHVHAKKVSIKASPDGVVVPELAVQAFVRTTLPKSSAAAGVDCGKSFIVAKVGQTLACKLTLGPQERDIKVTVKDERGTIAVGS